MARYNGFTCPKCGSHYFGTSLNVVVPKTGQPIMPQFPPNVQVGHCHARSHEQGECNYHWDRSNKEAEDQAIYQQTPEEWAEEWARQNKATAALFQPSQEELNNHQQDTNGPTQ